MVLDSLHINKALLVGHSIAGHGTATVIKGGNHYLFLSHPAETEKLIRDFLK